MNFKNTKLVNFFGNLDFILFPTNLKYSTLLRNAPVTLTQRIK